MNEDKIQIDLFDQKDEKEKSKILRKFKQYPRQRFLPIIRVPLEYTVMISIGVLLLMMIAYAVGVETGKRNIVAGPGGGDNIPIQHWDKVPERSDAMNDEQDHVQEEEKTVLAEAEKIPPEAVPSAREITPSSKTVYMLQLASFKSEGAAKEEVNDLKKKGLDAVMAKHGDWYQVYAEGYRTIEEAKAAQKILVEDYKDCYIKKVNQ